MDRTTSHELLNRALSEKRPFVCYRKPNSTKVKVLVQQDDRPADFDFETTKGFLFAPFDANNELLFIPNERSLQLSFDILTQTTVSNPEPSLYLDAATADAHKELVEKAIRFIQDGQAHKIVLSRKETLSIERIPLLDLYLSLARTYPNAFAYLWFHPISGAWLGATPETLITCSQGQFQTMALAGTRISRDHVGKPWGAKEIREQQLVVDQIQDKLHGIDLKISDRITKKAGAIEHLCTIISGELRNQFSLEKLVRLLHPTAAICGLPTEVSKSFILANEGYDREYYTGFLGEWQPEEKGGAEASLFVNLRCMKLESPNYNKASIYVGGGITSESDSDDEVMETVAKSKVMKRLLPVKTTSSN